MTGLKLGGVENGFVYAMRGLSTGTWDPSRGFTPVGSIPGSDLLARITDRSILNRLLGHVAGFITTTNLWPIGRRGLLATAGGELFLSTDGGRSWELVHDFPESSGPMGVLPTAVSRHDGRVFLAEYPLGDDDARVLVSDDGRQWSTYVRCPNVRHFHGLFHDPYSGALWGTTGDSDEECAIGKFEDGTFYPVGTGSQQWRAVELAFTPDSILWGMDSSYAPAIQLLRLPREEIPDRPAEVATDRPSPEVVGTIDAPVFYAKSIRSGGSIWVVLSTASPTGVDSTGPAVATTGNSRVRVLAASARSGFKTWYELFAFDRTTPLGESVPSIPTANAYVFLATVDNQLLVNPFNTTRNHGRILVRESSSFRDAPRMSIAGINTRTRKAIDN